MPSQDYAVDDLSSRCFKCSKMKLFEPMCESSYCRGEKCSVFGGWFVWFLGKQLANEWLCTAQNWVFCVVLMVRLSSFYENFCWIWVHLETHLQSTATYFRCHMCKSTIHHLSRCHRRVSKHRNCIFEPFLSINRHEPLFELLTNCGGLTRTNFVDSEMFMHYWLYAGHPNG